MKNLIIVLFLAIGFMGCGGNSAEKAGDNNTTVVPTAEEMQGPEYASAYVCPMHCKGSGSAAVGQCPVCGMDYVRNENHQQDGHEGHDHSGHDHSGHDHSGHNH